MEKVLSVLIVEDDPKACNEFINLIDGMEDMTIIGITNNALKAVEEIRYKLPDAVILDLELHQGSGSGLDVLQELKNSIPAVMPYILVTTNNSSSITYELARNLGADYILSKHQDNYSEKYAVNLLKILAPAIKSRSKYAPDGKAQNEAPEYYEKRLTQRVIKELNLIGINPKAKGYQYLIKAIIFTIKGAQGSISPLVAKEMGKTELSVERAMQNAINRAWATSDINDLLENYTAKINPARGKPTLTEFICYYATKIKNS